MRHLAVMLAVAMLSVGFIALLPTASAAPMTRYWVTTFGSTSNCDWNNAPGTTPDWENINCWSLTSGGATGASVPDANTDVIVDSGSKAGIDIGKNAPTNAEAHDITIAASYNGPSAPYVAVLGSFSSSLSVHSIVFNFVGEGYINLGSGGITYSGIIQGGVADGDSCTASANPGVCMQPSPNPTLIYTGPVANSMSNIEMGAAGSGAIDASGGNTVYCFPGCTDDGGNTNVVFGPAPVPPAGGSGGKGPNSLITPSQSSVLLTIGVLSLIVGFLALLVVKPLGIIILMVGAFLVVIALFA